METTRVPLIAMERVRSRTPAIKNREKHLADSAANKGRNNAL
jgi:hypothetical protein